MKTTTTTKVKKSTTNHPNRKKATPAAAAAIDADHNHADPIFDSFRQAVMKSFDDLVYQPTVDTAGVRRGLTVPVYTTDASDLFELFIAKLPEGQRQYHRCSCCRRFIERFGGLVTIDANGSTTPIMWSNAADTPKLYYDAGEALFCRVAVAKVTGVFITKEAEWGQAKTGPWTHLAVTAPAQIWHREIARTAGQKMAAKREDFQTVMTALGDVKPQVLDEALRVLKSGTLDRSDKFLAPLQWLRDLQDRPKGRQGSAVVWRAIATAPDGFCHPRASVLWPLVEAVQAGMPFEDIKRKFNAMLHPLQYQRPHAAPSAGNIKAAEDLVEKLGIAKSLERRYATMADVQEWIWTSVAETPDTTGSKGVFAHLKAKDANELKQVDIPAISMSWAKFQRTVLPGAIKVEFMTPHAGNFSALTAAADASAPPILKWDRDDARNSVAIYMYHPSSVARRWGLQAGVWTALTGITKFPWLWGMDPMPFMGDGIFLTLAGAKDQQHIGAALFPETMRTELHGCRSVIEAYSASAMLSGLETADACGYSIGSQGVDFTVRVFDGNALQKYRIDRWD